MKRLIHAAAVLALFATASIASANQGTTFLGLQLVSGTADLAGEFGNGSAPAYDHSEWGFKAELWSMMSEDYAFNFSAGYGLFSEENKAGTNAAPTDGTFKYSNLPPHSE